MSQENFAGTLDALDVAKKITEVCHRREIPIPLFETLFWDGDTRLAVKWFRSNEPDHKDVNYKTVEDAMQIEFTPANGLGNREAETTIDGIAVEFTIYA